MGYISSPINISGAAQGDAFAFDTFNVIVTPRNDAGGTITGSLTFAGESIASLGLITGSYDIALPHDKITLNIGPLATVPLPATAPLALAALGALGLIRRRAQS